jgi:hypothetical protein
MLQPQTHEQPKLKCGGRAAKDRLCVDCGGTFKRARRGPRCNHCEHKYNKTHGAVRTCAECKIEYQGHSAKYCLTCRKHKWRTGVGFDRPSNSARARKNNSLKTTYGITIEQFEALYAQQNGECAICGTHKSLEFKRMKDSLVVDHDHQTNAVRGLLCQTCNSGMGQLKDSVDLLEKAIHYLKRSR